MARDGGELQIWPDSADADWAGIEPVRVAPLGGRLVVLCSCLRHEVLASNRPRRAMQHWIFRPDRAPASVATRRARSTRLRRAGLCPQVPLRLPWP